MTNFIDRCVLGESSPEDIEDCIDQWHITGRKGSLAGYLGMTRFEYVLWLFFPDILPSIIVGRRKPL